MDGTRSSVRGTLTLVILSLLLGGCAATIKSSRVPLLQSGSPLKSISPKVFAIKEFDNASGVKPGVIWSIGMGHKVVLDDPVEVIVSDAIRNELERNGQKCIGGDLHSNTDFLVEGTVYKYSHAQDVRNMGFSIEVKGTVAVKLTVSRVSQHEEFFTKNYEGTSTKSSAVLTENDRVETLNEALMDMVKKISTDEELISFLEK
jgi:hypothetical protein